MGCKDIPPLYVQPELLVQTDIEVFSISCTEQGDGPSQERPSWVYYLPYMTTFPACCRTLISDSSSLHKQVFLSNHFENIPSNLKSLSFGNLSSPFSVSITIPDRASPVHGSSSLSGDKGTPCSWDVVFNALKLCWYDQSPAVLVLRSHLDNDRCA